jgi:hypothetical protein
MFVDFRHGLLDQGGLLALADHLQTFTEDGCACYVPVWKLSAWLSKYDPLGLDPHCRLSIDPHCIGKAYPGRFEVRQLEITLFEDLASLFNLAREKYIQTVATHEPAKVELKLAVALYRAIVSAAFYFVECFMNELAADCVWKLARVRFVGPITIEVRYETKDEINAFRRDLDFVRKGSRGIRRQVAS